MATSVQGRTVNKANQGRPLVPDYFLPAGVAEQYRDGPAVLHVHYQSRDASRIAASRANAGADFLFRRPLRIVHEYLHRSNVRVSLKPTFRSHAYLSVRSVPFPFWNYTAFLRKRVELIAGLSYALTHPGDPITAKVTSKRPRQFSLLLGPLLRWCRSAGDRSRSCAAGATRARSRI